MITRLFKIGAAIIKKKNSPHFLQLTLIHLLPSCRGFRVFYYWRKWYPSVYSWATSIIWFVTCCLDVSRIFFFLFAKKRLSRLCARFSALAFTNVLGNILYFSPGIFYFACKKKKTRHVQKTVELYRVLKASVSKPCTFKQHPLKYNIRFV